MIDNTSFIYIFLNKELFSETLVEENFDDFIEGIRVGSSFDGGYLKKYILK
jgi:hypothetical protein